MRLLAIETSCDETAIAVINAEGGILSDLQASQCDLHNRYGGVVPEIACRRHVEVIGGLIQDALLKAGTSFENLNAISVTTGPGLIGALLVGVSLAKSLAYTLNLPLIPVHHLEGHICAAFIEQPEIASPSVALVASGGHTNLYALSGEGEYRLLGRTFDDAAGEALDKAARMLSLGYPGGPVLDRLAKAGDPKRILFPRPFRTDTSLDFSFSGLKTALRHYLSRQPKDFIQENLSHIAAGYQEALVDVLVEKSLAAVRKLKARSLLVVGGVAANSRLRERLLEEAALCGVDLVIPHPRYCTDNGAMIAMAGLRRFRQGRFAPLDLNPKPDLELSALYA